MTFGTSYLKKKEPVIQEQNTNRHSASSAVLNTPQRRASINKYNCATYPPSPEVKKEEQPTNDVGISYMNRNVDSTSVKKTSDTYTVPQRKNSYNKYNQAESLLRRTASAKVTTTIMNGTSSQVNFSSM